MHWVRVGIGAWLNLDTVVFARRLTEEGQKVSAVQVAVNAADPGGAGPQNDNTGLVSFIYLGQHAERILRHFRD
jgi:hypothetical protein